MGKIVKLRPPPRKVSLVRRRDEALHLLIPKLLGVLWEAGRADKGPSAIHGKVTAPIESQIEVGGYLLGPGRFGIHVYVAIDGAEITKVFSAHLGDPSVVDSRLFPYYGGRCGILSWKRGPWEDRIVAEKIEPRTVAHLMTAGFTRESHC
jgi:hypothetical protein